MQLIHTSPELITKILDDGKFGSFLFFSCNEYVTTAGSYVTYSIDISDEDVIDVLQLFYHKDAIKLNDLISDVEYMCGVDSDTAEALLEQSVSLFNISSSVDSDSMGEIDWRLQRLSADAGKLLDYRVISMRDEQGTAYMIDMLDKESDLILV